MNTNDEDNIFKRVFSNDKITKKISLFNKRRFIKFIIKF